MIQDTDSGQSQQSDMGVHEVRNAVLALSGVEFLSQSLTKTVEPGVEHSTGNFMKEKLFQNNERLFNSFSYGESKRG